MRFPSAFIMVAVVVLAAVPVFAAVAQDGEQTDPAIRSDPLLEEARRLAAEGEVPEAAEMYTRWLTENSAHPDFGSVVLEAADSQVSVERSLELLRVYTPRVQDPKQRQLCLASQIDLLEMLGRSEQALGLLRSFPPTAIWLYRQSLLLYQQGLLEEAENSLQQALGALLSRENREAETGQDRELEARIRLLQARIFAAAGRDEEADSLYGILEARFSGTASGPAILLAYFGFLRDRGRTPDAEKQLQALSERFPDSPELALAREGGGGISYAPAPWRLLPGGGEMPRGAGGRPAAGDAPEPGPQEPQEPAGVLVQTGSFRDLENAQYLIRDLQAAGFGAEIVEKSIAGSLYYRVVIGPQMSVEEAQNLLMRLKDARFEGVLLFPE